MQTLGADTALEELVESGRPYVLYFTATWCGPCKQFGPHVEAVSQELGDRFAFAKVDFDDHPDLAGRYDVMGVPTLMVFQGDQVLMSSTGAMSRARLARALATVAASLPPPHVTSPDSQEVSS